MSDRSNLYWGKQSRCHNNRTVHPLHGLCCCLPEEGPCPSAAAEGTDGTDAGRAEIRSQRNLNFLIRMECVGTLLEAVFIDLSKIMGIEAIAALRRIHDRCMCRYGLKILRAMHMPTKKNYSRGRIVFFLYDRQQPPRRNPSSRHGSDGSSFFLKKKKYQLRWQISN